MEKIGDAILTLLGTLEEILKKADINTVATKTNAQHRTIKQIVGHLCDSASNNTHRIVHLQYQSNPLIFPDYANLGKNDLWIKLQDYQNYDWEDLQALLKATAKHVVHVIKNVDETKLQNEWISALNERISLEAMIVDFPRHFKLHLDEIVALLKD
ncbi:hypothetical protein [Sulfurospirillum cavolei]|uniref:hypothetical protein n=1 Tax=Sulfurospirillum cavolei TaxID=366522 RepID=UPI0007649CEF|nr:hypothetical protein [Sulfurospirillum cavolei]